MNNTMNKQQFEEKLLVGTKIKIGRKYADEQGFKEGEIITLVNGTFKIDKGTCYIIEHAPSVWSESQKDFDSIYHLFGNDFENFLDCVIIDN